MEKKGDIRSAVELDANSFFSIVRAKKQVDEKEENGIDDLKPIFEVGDN